MYDWQQKFDGTQPEVNEAEAEVTTHAFDGFVADMVLAHIDRARNYVFGSLSFEDCVRMMIVPEDSSEMLHIDIAIKRPPYSGCLGLSRKHGADIMTSQYNRLPSGVYRFDSLPGNDQIEKPFEIENSLQNIELAIAMGYNFQRVSKREIEKLSEFIMHSEVLL
jgi:hypothetical protein